MPVLLEVRGARVVVVGHGTVGKRKAAAALRAGASVVAIDPASRGPSGPGLRHPGPDGPRLAILPVPYRPEHLDGARLVFACATPDVNARVVADAKARGVWVNSATDPSSGDVELPAVARAGGLTVAVSTGGASPALARRVRERLEAQFDAAFAEWVALLAELRAEALATVPDAVRRRALLDELSDWPWLDRLRTDGVAATRSAMRDVIAASRGPSGPG